MGDRERASINATDTPTPNEAMSPRPLARSVHGLTRRTPHPWKSDVLRVATARSCALAVAASSASVTPMGRPARRRLATSRPHRPAVSASMGSTRPAKRSGRSRWTHPSRRVRRGPAASNSTPWRSSPRVMTLRNTRSSSRSASQATTPASGRGLTHSDTTFVSRRIFTVAPCATCPGFVEHEVRSRAVARPPGTRRGCRCVESFGPIRQVPR